MNKLNVCCSVLSSPINRAPTTCLVGPLGHCYCYVGRGKTWYGLLVDDSFILTVSNRDGDDYTCECVSVSTRTTMHKVNSLYVGILAT